MLADFFYCPVCKQYTIDTYTPALEVDRCPLCGTVRPDDAPNLTLDLATRARARRDGNEYIVRDGFGKKVFRDERVDHDNFVKVRYLDGGMEPTYLILSDDQMGFALGDEPEPSGDRVVEKELDGRYGRFGGNGPVKVRYTSNAGLIGSLNIRPKKKGRRAKRSKGVRR